VMEITKILSLLSFFRALGPANRCTPISRAKENPGAMAGALFGLMLGPLWRVRCISRY
jgi:hypothetical protein